jgi:hypothetical protein
VDQGSIVARQPADLHRRQIEIVSRLYAHRPAREGLENELLKSRHPRKDRSQILRRGETQTGPAMLYAPGPTCFVTSLDPHVNQQCGYASSQKQIDYANSGKSIFGHAKDAIELKFSRLGRRRRVGRRSARGRNK